MKNGDAWHVERRHLDGSLSVRSMAHGGRVRLPAAYVAEHVELLYATTTHRAQGSTVDTAHPLITAGMTRENLYVLASRARDKTTFYVSTHDLPFDEDDRVDRVRTDPRAYDAREILLAIIATEGAPLSVTETIAAAQDEAGSLATLVPRYLHAAHQDAEHRYALAAAEALGEQDGARLTADPAWGVLAERTWKAPRSARYARPHGYRRPTGSTATRGPDLANQPPARPRQARGTQRRPRSGTQRDRGVGVPLGARMRRRCPLTLTTWTT